MSSDRLWGSLAASSYVREIAFHQLSCGSHCFPPFPFSAASDLAMKGTVWGELRLVGDQVAVPIRLLVSRISCWQTTRKKKYLALQKERKLTRFAEGTLKHWRKSICLSRIVYIIILQTHLGNFMLVGLVPLQSISTICLCQCTFLYFSIFLFPLSFYSKRKI